MSSATQLSPSPDSTQPHIGIWFGNFFEPFYSNREAVRRGIAECATLGFTAINLDSKPWEDFFARYEGKPWRGEPASPYVAMQEYMMSEAAANGLDYTCLALYLCGDNLYPTIRDVPSVRGEESLRADGKPMGTYKYWSPVAQQTMVEHVHGLLRLYGKGMRRHYATPERVVMQTMFDPILKPSFDDEGRKRYLAWLEKHYHGNIAALNQRYALNAANFAALAPADYWLRPEKLDWVDCATPTADDFTRRTPDFHRWIDNQTWLAAEMENYFATMKQHWRNIPAPLPPIHIEPVLHQWGYFFNPPGQFMWPTNKRALDIYRLAPHVDSALFIASPLNAENRPDAFALSVEGSILRSANMGRPFTGGLYLGRHVNGDIYRTVPPAESIATLVAAGATSFHIYGYSGLDDGGVLYRMDDVFKDSLRDGNRWAAEVMPLLRGANRAKQVAILFPAEMSLYETPEGDPDGAHRMDLLGWYQQLVELGWHVDIIHPAQITDPSANTLASYKTLIVPHNSLYDLGENATLESAVKSFVTQGGTLLHGPHCQLAQRAFGIKEETAAFDCIRWREDVIPHGWSTVSYKHAGVTSLANYIRSGATAIAETKLGAGRIFSFGFQYGYSWSRLTMPIVPPNYGRSEMHPVVLLKHTPVEILLGTSPSALITPARGIECARFGDHHAILINHRASPIDISALTAKARRTLAQVPSAPGWLAAHSAVYVELGIAP